MNGVLVIDKPAGWTSHDVVAKIRNLTKIHKVGHTGTLDPFATGVLPLTLGRATRLTGHFLASDKVYHGVMRLGFATATFDRDGDPLNEDTLPELSRDRLEEIFSRYRGIIRQTLPPYSAKKIRGKPMYSYARKGIEMEAATKEVTIRSLRLIGIEGSEVEFELECSAGTYARSLAHDVGRDYGCGAHLVRLHRVRSGEFSIEHATPLGEGGTIYPREHFLKRIIPLRLLLPEIPSITITAEDRRKVLHGSELNLLTSAWESEEFRLIDEEGELVALSRRVQSFVSPIAQPAHWVRIHPYILFAIQEP